MPRFAPFALALLVSACGGEEKAPTTPRKEPDRVLVDHILIGVTNPKLAGVNRTPEEARKLAYDLLKRLEGGADWAALKGEYSADPPPGGPYALANRGVAPETDEHPRSGMVSAFGDVGFGLEVGGIGIADYTPGSKACPYGFHIIKRLR
jgi:hypothetical protein